MMEKSILQPATLLMMRQEYSLTQLKIMVAMTTKLQTIMHQQLNSLRPMEPEKMITEKDLSPSGGLWVEIDGTEPGMRQQGLRQLEGPHAENGANAHRPSYHERESHGTTNRQTAVFRRGQTEQERTAQAVHRHEPLIGWTPADPALRLLQHQSDNGILLSATDNANDVHDL